MKAIFVNQTSDFSNGGQRLLLLIILLRRTEQTAFLKVNFLPFSIIDVSECPSYTDNSKKANNKPHFDNGKAYSPCNTWSCLKECVCEPCQDPVKYSQSNSFKCPQHPIDHPEMYDESEDLAINRRQFVDNGTKQPIFKRPAADSFLCPPPIKLAQMKKNCKMCKIVFDDHKKQPLSNDPVERHKHLSTTKVLIKMSLGKAEYYEFLRKMEFNPTSYKETTNSLTLSRGGY